MPFKQKYQSTKFYFIKFQNTICFADNLGTISLKGLPKRGNSKEKDPEALGQMENTST